MVVRSEESPENIMNALSDLYSANIERMAAVRESFRDVTLEGPLLMDLDLYWRQPVKLMIVGQETFGWDCNYKDLESLKESYRKFNFGLEYYSSPFWNITRKVERLLGIPPYSCAWTNLNRFDYGGGPVPNHAAPTLAGLDDLLREEIRIASPDVCLLYTNRKYDWRLEAIFPDLEFKPVECLPFNHFCRLEHPMLPRHTYRTPHPRTIRTRKWESAFFSVLEREVPKVTSTE